MPDQRSHRGPHPEDARLFSPETVPRLREAVSDLCWLLERGYADRSSLALVGDRYALDERQRKAVYRCACSPQHAADRRRREVTSVAGEVLELDGFNVLITVEAALSHGVLLRGRDGCVRDLASMHGSYRKVEETVAAIAHLRALLDELAPAACRWYLDAPVSNSGRLKTLLAAQGWEVELVPNPDRLLAESRFPVSSSDRYILDRCARWYNLAGEAIRRLPVEVLEL